MNVTSLLLLKEISSTLIKLQQHCTNILPAKQSLKAKGLQWLTPKVAVNIDTYQVYDLINKKHYKAQIITYTAVKLYSMI